MGTTHFGSIFCSGPVYSQGAPLLPFTTGTVRFVSSTTAGASDNNAGTDITKPCATIDGTIGKCTANVGDVIAVLPGHAETISAAAGILADVAGISILGVGFGSMKPTLTFSTATTATLNVTAANVRIANIRFVSNIDSLGMFLDLDADWFLGEDLDFVTSSGKEAVNFINIATTKDNFRFRRCTALQPTDPAGTDGGADTGFVYIVDSENILFEDCEVYGNFETAIFHNRTTACKNLWVKNCRGIQSLSGAEPFQLVDGANGAMLGGGFITPAEASNTEATLVGTLGNSFFILQPGAFGNDGGAGGQGGIVVATAS